MNINRGTSIVLACAMLRDLPREVRWQDVALVLEQEIKELAPATAEHRRRTAYRWLGALEAGRVIEKIGCNRYRRVYALAKAKP